jgi:CHAT domain-containing protein/tetratricopeptide (TPR) repeat protein
VSSLDTLREQIHALHGIPEKMPETTDLCRQALELVSREAQPELWAALNMELGLCLMLMRDEEPVQNLEKAIYHFEQSLEVFTRRAHPEEWASIQHNLGTIYGQRAPKGRADNWEEAIEYYKNALRVFTREDYPQEWADATFNLANIYLRWTGEKPRDNLDQAIAMYKTVLQVRKRETYPIEWAEIQCNLGTAWKNYRWGDYAAHVEKAIEYYQAVLSKLNPQDHPRSWARAKHGLGTAYWSRIKGNRQENVKRAIACYEAALKVRKRETSPVEWAETKRNLAVAYTEYYQEDWAKNLEHAIEILEQVRQVQTQDIDPLGWAETTCDLANTYFHRVRDGRLGNLERAIKYYEEALLVQRNQGALWGWGPVLHNLAVAYGERLSEDRLKNLEKAAQYGREALGAFDRDALLEWATAKTDMVDILWKKANLERQRGMGQAAATMKEAIGHGEEVVSALEGQPPSHRLALAHYNLGNAYSDILREGQPVSVNQEKAIEHYSRALDFYTRQDYPARWADTHNNLAVTYLERLHKDRAENVKKAIHHFSEALKVCTPDTFSVSTRRAARNLGNLHSEERHWQEAVASYRIALQATEELYQASLLRRSKEAELGQTADLYRRAAYAFARSDDLKRAVVALEQGRARLLAEALERDRADLEALKSTHSELYDGYIDTASRIAGLTRREMRAETLPSGADMAAEMRAAREELDQVAEAIRQVPGCEGFLAQPGFDDIAGAVLPDMPLAYLAATPAGGMALIVHGQDVDRIWLDDLTDAALSRRVRGWFETYSAYLKARQAYGRAGREMRSLLASISTSARQAWLTVLEDTLRWLWAVLMEPLVTKLRKLGYHHATLMPTGLLAFLPLHAAWHCQDTGPHRRYALDDVAFAYAPSARALTHARRLATVVRGENLFALDNPDRSLRYSEWEVKSVARHFADPWIASGDHATRNTTLYALPECDVYHFSCHGNNDWGDPMESKLWMFGGAPLALRDLLTLESQPQARLAFLSACETGLIGAELPDEVVGLASGFLEVGAAGVVSTLWAVADESTALLAGQFYDNWRTQGMDPLQALVSAQQWLRDLSAGELAKRFEAEEHKPEHLMPYEQVLHAHMRFAGLHPHVRPFAHPAYWAAFTLNGV